MYKYLFFIFLIIWACKEKSIDTTTIPKIDTLFHITGFHSPISITYNKNKVIYYGSLFKKIHLPVSRYGISYFRDPISYWTRQFPIVDSIIDFKIIVDTTILPLTIKDYNFSNDTTFHIDSTSNYSEDMRLGYIQSFPVYLINESKYDKILEVQDHSAYIIMEAKDSLGVWRPIEYWRRAIMCGNSFFELILKPKSIYLVQTTKYRGPFKTMLRIKFRNFNKIKYSPPFRGSINYSQFNSDSLKMVLKKTFLNYHPEKADSAEYYSEMKLKEALLD